MTDEVDADDEAAVRAAQAFVEADQPQSFEAPREESSGPLVDAVLSTASWVTPADAVNVFTTAYPDLNGARAGFTSGGIEYVVSIQRVPKPISLASLIETGTGVVTFRNLGSGTQRVTINGPDNSFSQVVLVHTKGVSVTVTVTQQVGAGRGASLPDLTETATQALDVPHVRDAIMEAASAG